MWLDYCEAKFSVVTMVPERSCLDSCMEGVSLGMEKVERVSVRNIGRYVQDNFDTDIGNSCGEVWAKKCLALKA